jgi:hypothetical protein
VSKPIAYDSLLVRALAAELQKRYHAQQVRSVRFDVRTRTLSVFFRRLTLEWNLDPAGGSLRETAAFGGPTGMQLPRRTHVERVHMEPDDRVLQWILRAREPAGGREFHLWIELLPNRRLAVLAAEDGRVLGEAAALPEFSGGYHPRRSQPRDFAGALPSLEEFSDRLGRVALEDRTRALLAGFAYTSPINAAAILGPPDDLAGAWQRYVAMLEAAPGAVVLDPDGVAQPYPVALPGVPSISHPDLLCAFFAVRTTTAVSYDRSSLLDALHARRRALERRVARMEQESANARQEAADSRRMADLLLSQLSRVTRGRNDVELDDWTGGTIRVPLDPALDGASNATRLYEKARKRERAAERLPVMIANMRRAQDDIAAAIARLEHGEWSVEQAAAFLPESAQPAASPRSARVPFRRYRTTGGLEVRVGRNSRSNDELTLRYSSPDDIWLHARDAAGAHVVLRWNRPEENPPAADLAEAAVLAALHSRAATSRAVAVDWTRRKHVRKPRKARPGLVMIDRAKTIFVEPDVRLEERLRVE